jgi:predicted nucleic acid-binding Zn ribbon protein
MVGVFHCTRCWTFLDDRPPGNPVLCDECRELVRAAKERQERRARVVGRQPLICECCAGPFVASRISQRFCSTRCRMAAWRERQRAVT